MATVDVTIRGAGILGLSVAWACIAKGARVRVVDPFGPGAGASGGLVGALAPHVPDSWNDKKAFQFDSLIAAEGFWQSVSETSGLPTGYTRSGRLQPVPDDRALHFARSRADQAKTLWQGKALWQLVPADAFPGWAPVSASGYLVHDTLTARIAPRRACASLVAALLAKGGELTRDATDQGKVVWATGVAGLEALSREVGKPVGSGVKGQGALLDFDARDLPQLFANAVHIVPHADGTTAIGSTSENVYQNPDKTDSLLDGVLERARSVCPALAGAAVLERWAGVRPRAKSRAPMLGAYPGRPGHFIANGGFKIGFGMAPKIGAVMADLVLDGRDAIPDAFRVAACL